MIPLSKRIGQFLSLTETSKVKKESKGYSRFWKEKYIRDCCFYCGLLTKGDVRLGFTLGNRDSSVDLFVFTFGFMR